MIKSETAKLIVKNNKIGTGVYDVDEFEKIINLIDKKIKDAIENKVVFELPIKHYRNEPLFRKLKEEVRRNGYSISTRQSPKVKTKIKVTLRWK